MKLIDINKYKIHHLFTLSVFLVLGFIFSNSGSVYAVETGDTVTQVQPISGSLFGTSIVNFGWQFNSWQPGSMLLSILSGGSAYVQTGNYLQGLVAKAGGTGNDQPFGIDVDSGGDSYIAGQFQGTTSFGSIPLTSSGSDDIFVSKLSSTGLWLWAVKVGGTGSDIAYSITVDSGGNSYVGGYYSNIGIFGQIVLVSSGGNNIFIAKLSSTGVWLWATGAGGESSSIKQIAIDSGNNIYIAGYFGTTWSFGSTTLVSSGGNEILVAKLSSAGEWLWAKKAGGTSTDVADGMAIDNGGNVYIVGHLDATASFGSTTFVSSGGYDIFVAKLSSTGEWLWAKKAGGAYTDNSYGIAVDSGGNSYVVGNFIGTGFFGSIPLVTDPVNDDGVVAKLSSTGEWLWASQVSGSSDSQVLEIELDRVGNPYVVGYFYSTGSFGSTTLISSGDMDIFLAKLSSTGEWLWVRREGGAYRDMPRGFTLDINDNPYLAIDFSSTTKFGSTTLSSSGGTDIVVYQPQYFYKSLSLADGIYTWDVLSDGAQSNFRPFSVDTSGPLVGTAALSSGYTFTTGSTIRYKGILDIQATVLDRVSGVNSGSCQYIQNSSGFTASYAGTINSGICYVTGVDAQADISVRFTAQDMIGNRGTGGLQAYSYDVTAPAIGNTLCTNTLMSGGTYMVSIVWNGYDGGVGISGYYYEFASDVSMTTIISSGVTTSSSVTLLGLNSGQAYYWRLSADDYLGNTSAWSDVVDTTINSSACPIIVQITPISGSLFATSVVNFGWQTNSWQPSSMMLSILSGGLLYTQTGNYLQGWAVKAGGTGADVANSIVVDSSGNKYVVGYFNGTATFGSTTLVSSGGNFLGEDIFIAKMSNTGVWLWAIKGGGTGQDIATDISIDDDGNIYVAGYFSNTASFGSTSFVSSGNEDAFVAKLSGTGSWLRVVRVFGSSNQNIYGIDLDSGGNSYVAGTIGAPATFGSITVPGNGSDEAFVAKLSNTGAWLRAVGFDNGRHIATSIVVDSGGNSYAAGKFEGTATFGSTAMTSNGYWDMFVSKFSNTGAWGWSVSAGGILYDQTLPEGANDISIDNDGNIYVVGTLCGTASFGSTTLVGSGNTDIFAAKLSGTGAWMWAVRAGGSSDDIAKGVTIDSDGNTYVVGNFKNTATFGSNIVVSSGTNSDAFATHLSSAGAWLGVTKAGGTSSDGANAIALDSGGNSYVVGYFSGIVNFGATTLNGSGGDIFVRQPRYFSKTLTLADGRYTWDVLAGWIQTAYWPFTVDTSPPLVGTATLSSGYTFTTGSNIRYKGILDIQATVSDWISGISTGSCQYIQNSSGFTATYTGTINSGICYVTGVNAQADISVRFTAQDVAGNRGTGGLQTYRYDGSSPVLSNALCTNPSMSGGVYIVSFVWDAYDGGVGTSGYHYEIASDISMTTIILSGDTMSSSISALGLNSGQAYYRRVSAYDYLGNSALSDVVNTTTTNPYGCPSITQVTPSSGSFVLTSVVNFGWQTNGRQPSSMILSVLSGGDLYAQTGVYSQGWATKAGGGGLDYSMGVSIDGSGNKYIIGYFLSSTASFGSIGLLCSGSFFDIFVAKISSTGAWLWATKAGGTSVDYGRGIIVDSGGNSYVVGSFSGTAVFGTTALVSSGSDDIFIGKLSNTGAWIWVTKAGGTGSDVAYSIALDSGGNSYAVGSFVGTSIFGSTTLASSGNNDIFIGKISSTGVWLWVKQAGGVSSDIAYSIAVDSGGTNSVVGVFGTTGMFGPTMLLGSGSNDVFVAKLSSTGEWMWATQAGGIRNDYAYGVAIDSNGNNYIAGYFQGTGNFGSTMLVYSGYYDIFIAKLSSTGEWMWATQAGGNSYDIAYSIAVDDVGNSYVAGYFNETGVFGSTTLVTSGSNNSDIFIGKLNSAGSWLWARSAGGNNGAYQSDTAYGVALDAYDNPSFVGIFGGTAAIFSGNILTSDGGFDIFVRQPRYFYKTLTLADGRYTRDVLADGIQTPYRPFVVDTSVPLVGTATLSSGYTFTAGSIIRYKGLLDIQATVSDWVSGVNSGSCQYIQGSTGSTVAYIGTINSGICYVTGVDVQADISVRFTAQDVAGNRGTGGLQAYSYDATAPVLGNALCTNPSTSGGVYRVNITWSASDAGVGLSGYHYEIASDISMTTIVLSGDTTSSSINVLGLNSGQAYYRRVYAYDYLGNTSTWSNVVDTTVANVVGCSNITQVTPISGAYVTTSGVSFGWQTNGRLPSSMILNILSGGDLYAQTGSYWQGWAVKAGSTSDDYAMGISIDSGGNKYVVGYFQGTVSFGSTSLVSSGSNDIFISKISNTGSWMWTKKAGGTSPDYGRGIAIDSGGNSYIAGYFAGTGAFGSTVLVSSGAADIFVAKLSSTGEWLWAVQAGSTSDDNAYGIAIDSGGNSYVAGYFQLTGVFGASTLVSSGITDIFVAKLSDTGAWLFVKKAGGTSNDNVYGIAIDSGGNSYTVGSFAATSLFGSTSLVSSGSYDAFVSKLSSTGEWLRAKRAGGVSDDYTYGIAIDSGGNSHAVGSFAGTGGFGATTLVSSGSDDIFVSKLGSTGEWLWTNKAGGSSSDAALSVTVDSIDSTYVAGFFQGTGSFGTTTLISSGSYDIFVSKLNASGTWLGGLRGGGTGLDRAFGIAVDGNGNLCTVGNFASSVNFTGNTLTTSNGGYDIFVRQPRYFFKTLTIADGTYTWDVLADGIQTASWPFIVDASRPLVGTATISSGLYYTILSDIRYKGVLDIQATASDSFVGLVTGSCQYIQGSTGSTVAYTGTINSGICYVTGVDAQADISVRFTVQDVAGNIGTGGLQTYRYDNTVPIVGILCNDVTSGGTYRLSFTWSAGDDGAGISGYLYEIASDISMTTIVLSGTTTNNAIVVLGLDSGSVYYRRVYAYDNLGNTSAWSAIDDTSTNDPDCPSITHIIPESGAIITTTNNITFGRRLNNRQPSTMNLAILSGLENYLVTGAYTQGFAVQGGGSSTDVAYSIAVDNLGNRYVAGSFSTTATFGSTTLVSGGSTDIFVGKLSSTGVWLWAVQAGGTSADVAYRIAVDSGGNSYVVGSFLLTGIFGSTILRSSGSTDVFVAKLSDTGVWLWATKAGGTSTDIARNIAVDSGGNSYVAGYFAGTTNFLSTTLVSSGSNDVFVGKLSSTGVWLLAKKAGGTSNDLCYGLSIDSGGNSYVAGSFLLTGSFGSIALSNSGSSDIFVSKLSDTGVWLRAKKAGGTSADTAYSIATDSGGNSYVAGSFNGTVSFGSASLFSNGSTDIFISKMSSTGEWLWAKKAGGTGADLARSIAVDSLGNSYIAGAFDSTATFGSLSLSNTYATSDAFVAKLNSIGVRSSAGKGGGTGDDIAYAITIDTSGTISVAGSSAGVVDFGTDLISYGGTDVFVWEPWYVYTILFVPDGDYTWRISTDIMLSDPRNLSIRDISPPSNITNLCTSNATSLETGFYFRRDASTDGGMGLSGYYYEISDETGMVVSGSVENPYIFVSGLLLDRYYRRVRGVDMAGNMSDWSHTGDTSIIEDDCLVDTITHIRPGDTSVLTASNIGIGRHLNGWNPTTMTLYLFSGGVSYLETGSYLQGLVTQEEGNTLYDSISTMAFDTVGNAYAIGAFGGTGFFGSTTLVSSGSQDIFVAKMSSTGTWLWAVQAGGGDDGSEEIHSVTADSIGNSYVAGVFSSASTVFGSTILSNNGNDVFVAKLSSTGEWLRAEQAGIGSDGSAYISRMAIDSGENIYAVGYFDGTVSFGSTQLISDWDYDIFVAKLSSTGEWLRAVKAGGDDADYSSDVTLDSGLNIYVAGYFAGTSAFGSTSLVSSGSYDVFVSKLSSTGEWLWATQAGGINNDYVASVALDSGGNIYVAGYFAGTSAFGPTSLVSSGSYDIFVSKLSSTGEWLLATKAGGTAADIVQNIVIDNMNNAYIAGRFGGTSSFGSTSLVSSGSNDIFAARINSSGSRLGATSAGGVGSDVSYTLALDQSGIVYVAGYFQGTGTFGSTTLVSSGDTDIFVREPRYYSYIATGLSDGVYNRNVSADSIHSNLRSFTIDTIPPLVGTSTVVQGTTLDSGGVVWYNGPLNIDADVSDTASGIDLSSCLVIINNSGLSTLYTGTTSSGSCFVTGLDLMEDATIYFVAMDNVGHHGTGVDVLYRYDIVPPSLASIVAPESGFVSTTGRVTFTRDASVETGVGLSGYHYELSLDSGFASIFFSGTTTNTGIIFQGLTNGSYYRRIRADDYLGNQGAFSETYFVVALSTETIVTSTPGGGGGGGYTPPQTPTHGAPPLQGKACIYTDADYLERGPFTDISPNHRAYPYIESMRVSCLHKGRGTKGLRMYSPGAYITRAEALKTIVKILGIAHNDFFIRSENTRYTSAIPFADVSPTYWFAHYASYAYANGLVDGLTITKNGKNYLSPNTFITRDEAINLIMTAYEAINPRPIVFSGRSAMLDVNKDSPHYSSIRKAEVLGFVNGVLHASGTHSFEGRKAITRAAFAKIVSVPFREQLFEIDDVVKASVKK